MGCANSKDLLVERKAGNEEQTRVVLGVRSHNGVGVCPMHMHHHITTYACHPRIGGNRYLKHRHHNIHIQHINHCSRTPAHVQNIINLAPSSRSSPSPHSLSAAVLQQPTTEVNLKLVNNKNKHTSNNYLRDDQSTCFLFPLLCPGHTFVDGGPSTRLRNTTKEHISPSHHISAVAAAITRVCIRPCVAFTNMSMHKESNHHVCERLSKMSGREIGCQWFVRGVLGCGS